MFLLKKAIYIVSQCCFLLKFGGAWMLFVTCFEGVLQVVCGPHWIEVTKTHFAFTFKKLIRRLYKYSSNFTNRIASETLLSNIISYPVIYCKAVVEKVNCKLWLITYTNYWDVWTHTCSVVLLHTKICIILWVTHTVSLNMPINNCTGAE